MKKIFFQIAISVFRKQALESLENLVQDVEYKNFEVFVQQFKAFSEEVPSSVLASLGKAKSRTKLLEAYRKYDDKLLLSAYQLVFEVIDKKVKTSVLLNEFEQSIYDLGKELVQVYTNDNLENREEALAVFKANRKSLLLAALGQAEYLVNNAKSINTETKSKVKFAFAVAKNVVTELETLT